MNKVKETFSIGTRVCHKTIKKCNEGVVVWKHSEYGEVSPKLRGKIWSVHWSNGERGIYSKDEILRIAPKNVKKLVEQQLIAEDDGNEDKED